MSRNCMTIVRFRLDMSMSDGHSPENELLGPGTELYGVAPLDENGLPDQNIMFYLVSQLMAGAGFGVNISTSTHGPL